jgi:hypothetical protein
MLAQILLSRDQLMNSGHSLDEFPQPAEDGSSVRLLAVPDGAPPFDGDLSASDIAPVYITTGAIPGAGDTAITGATAAGEEAGEAAKAVASGGMSEKEPSAEGRDWPQQFAWLLTEALAGSRPARQILPWTTEPARIHFRRLEPAFRCGQRPRLLRVITTRPTMGVVEMTVIISLSARTRALAIRLEQKAQARSRARQGPVASKLTDRAMPTPRWVCTAIEAA